MDFDSLKTQRNDVVRDGAAFEAYCAPADLIDSSHPRIQAYARDVAGAGSDREKALRLYYAVRDGLRYDPYSTPMKREAYRASTTLETGHGFCINKAGVLAAVCRAAGIPARVGYADVRNHMTTQRLTDLMGNDTFYYHGYTEVWLGGRWVKATPAFNKELTAKFGLKPLDWDGVADSIYHPFDLGGRRHMEYLAYRGVFADIPFDEIHEAFRAYYPRMTREQEALSLGGSAGGDDFGAEGAAEAAKVRAEPRSAAYLALLISLSSFGPLTMSIYTPVMPLIGVDLAAGADAVKFTLTTYMVGFAVGQLFYGPLSDRFGRRPIVLVGVAFFTLTSFGCAFAPSIAGLIGLRVLQGLGAASGAVLGRALLRDAYDANEMPLVMSWIALAMNVSPAIAPSIGGFLGQQFGWRATFWFVGGFGTLLLLAVALFLGETNRHRSATIDLSNLTRGSGEMLRNRRFLGYILTLGFAFAINFGMLAGTPFILQDKLGFSPRGFGLIVLMSLAGFTAGTFANNRLIGRVPSASLLRIAGWFHVAALAIMATLSLGGVQTWWAITGPHMVLSFGSGMIGPNASAGAVGLYPRLAGTASSWVGLVQMGLGALGTVIIAVLTPIGSTYFALPLVVGLAPFAIATVLAARLIAVPPLAR